VDDKEQLLTMLEENEVHAVSISDLRDIASNTSINVLEKLREQIIAMKVIAVKPDLNDINFISLSMTLVLSMHYDAIIAKIDEFIVAFKKIKEL
jgi:hypothetical protein